MKSMKELYIMLTQELELWEKTDYLVIKEELCTKNDVIRHRNIKKKL